MDEPHESLFNKPPKSKHSLLLLCGTRLLNRKRRAAARPLSSDPYLPGALPQGVGSSLSDAEDLGRLKPAPGGGG